MDSLGSKCKVCGGRMKPLLNEEFCPNDCDRKPPPKPAEPIKVVMPGDPEWAEFFKDFYGTLN